MLRYKTKTRPGLVALYDIRPGNGAGPFLQPRSLHGANDWLKCSTDYKVACVRTSQEVDSFERHCKADLLEVLGQLLKF